MLWTRISPSSRDLARCRGELAIDPGQCRARLAGRPLTLSPLLFDLLVLLARNPRQLVTRQELKAALWPYAQRIDTDRRLNTAMRALRAELGDDTGQPEYIETVRGRGYRWIGRRTREAKRPGAPVVVAVLAALLSGTIALDRLSAPPQDRDVASIIRAQAAVDQWRSKPSPEALKRAVALVESAADDDSAAIHLLKGNLALEAGWDWKGAERQYSAALTRDPDNADARLALAWLSSNRGEMTAAMRLVRELIGSSALSEARRADVGWLLIRLDRPDLAAEACSASANSTINLLSCAHTAASMTRRTNEAKLIALDLMRKVGADAPAIAAVAHANSQLAYARFLDWRADHFLPDAAPLFLRAQVYADAGRQQEALAMLERSVALHEPLAIKIRSSPSFLPLRRDPRFRALALKVGVPA